MGVWRLQPVFDLIAKIPQFLFTWSFFFGAGLLLYLTTSYRLNGKLSLKQLYADCVPFNPIKSKSFHMDVVTYLVTKLSLFVWTIPGFAAYAALSTSEFDILHRLSGDMPVQSSDPIVALLCAVSVFIFAELAYYLVHYSNHKVPFLWELHKLHHSAEVLNPLTNTRAHPLSQTYKFVVIGIFTAVPSGFFMEYYGFTLPEIVVLTAVANKLASIFTLDSLRHSHFPISFGPLDAIFISPHMHHIHHSSEEKHFDKNFGLNLSLFDWLFRTGYKPAKDERMTPGIHGYSDEELQNFNTLKGAYLAPLKMPLAWLAKPFRQRRREMG